MFSFHSIHRCLKCLPDSGPLTPKLGSHKATEMMNLVDFFLKWAICFYVVKLHFQQCAVPQERTGNMVYRYNKAVLLFYIIGFFFLFLKKNIFGFFYMDVCAGEKKNSLLFLSYFIMWCYLVQHLLWTCLLMQAFYLFIYLKIVFFFFFFPWPALLPSLCLSRFKSGNTVKGTCVANNRVRKSHSLNAAARLQSTSPGLTAAGNPTGTNSLTTVV